MVYLVSACSKTPINQSFHFCCNCLKPLFPPAGDGTYGCRCALYSLVLKTVYVLVCCGKWYVRRLRFIFKTLWLKLKLGMYFVMPQVVEWHFWLKKNEIMSQLEEWIADLELYCNDKRVGRSISHSSASLKVWACANLDLILEMSHNLLVFIGSLVNDLFKMYTQFLCN